MDVSDVPSSQETVEDPALPGSPAEGATMIITPENAEARLNFSLVADWLQTQTEDPLIQAAQQHARKFMWISSKQQRDPEVTSLLNRQLTGTFSSSSPFSSPRDPTSSPTRPEQDKHQSPMELWRGHYYISLDEPPRNPLRGWTLGTAKETRHFNDLVLCIGSSESATYNIRRHQAVLQIHETSFVYIQAATDRSATKVNGRKISNKRVLNQSSAQISLGSLCYHVQYARGSYADNYPTKVQRYLDERLSIHTTLAALALTPTPSENRPITVGQWTISAGTVGKGGSGMVSIASNEQGKCVALKRMQVGRDRERIRKVQAKLEKFATLSERKKEFRLLRLIEVITDDVRSTNKIADVWFVQDPAAQDTLSTGLTRGLFKQGDERISIVTTVLAEILGATNFLHRNSWIHGDIKPVNIGIRTWTPECKSIVLLDLDDAQESPFPGRSHPARPGTGGTIGWLAPEREMTGYDELADIWSIGVMAIEMIRGRHPWRQGKNPWRPGSEATQLQKEFQDMYGEAVEALKKLHNEALKNTVLGMVRHPYAETSAQRQSRLTAKGALSLLIHAEDDENSSKRHRVS
ncbi:hypothetical protein FOVSG1_006310 [Fusarium oxysporum f. sp. vasinfectum]